MNTRHHTRRRLLLTATLSLICLSSLKLVVTTPLPVRADTPGTRVYLPIVVFQPTLEETPIPPDDLAVEEYIATQINQRRQAAGLPALALNSALTQAARAHCHDMSGQAYPSHTGSDGSSASDRVERAGYAGTYVGEIIAWGTWGSDDAIEWWMNSGPHRSMILSAWATEFGVGYMRDPESLYENFWTVDFGCDGS